MKIVLFAGKKKKKKQPYRCEQRVNLVGQPLKVVLSANQWLGLKGGVWLS